MKRQSCLYLIPDVYDATVLHTSTRIVASHAIRIPADICVFLHVGRLGVIIGGAHMWLSLVVLESARLGCAVIGYTREMTAAQQEYFGFGAKPRLVLISYGNQAIRIYKSLIFCHSQGPSSCPRAVKASLLGFVVLKQMESNRKPREGPSVHRDG